MLSIQAAASRVGKLKNRNGREKKKQNERLRY
jgi:hypothetical protein